MGYNAPQSGTTTINSNLMYGPSATPYTSFERGSVSVSSHKSVLRSCSMRLPPFAGDCRCSAPFGLFGDITTFCEEGVAPFTSMGTLPD